ncbi:acyl-CoA synthetase (AMP-forming)/AMP-acid ligase II [Brevibacterium luteolum]|nr:acyl-CoA synthetase (AMP-forming)/AMP-acid ligase II [Brevibacterium luteolum]
MSAQRELSYTSGTSSQPLLGDTIGANFKKNVARFADREALVDAPTGRRWTYAELDRDSDAVAMSLIDRGIAKGDRVGIWAQNLPEWTIVQYAAAKIGAILVNINPAYRAHELEYVIKQSGTTLLISQMAAPHSDFVALAREVAGAVANLRLVFIDTAAEEVLASPAGGLDESESFAHLLERGRELMDRPAVKADVRLATLGAELGADEPINIQYTSGTTGFPKGVTLSHHNILNNGYFIGELLGYTEEDIVCLPVPFFHCFGWSSATSTSTPTGRARSSPPLASTRRRPCRR